ncbi:MAG: translation initiation factor IF-2 [Candidatus Adlerbacteria bacterium]|nr:translation initiation factor IF-2 [Candidatus Adlerbacteria bacterium]
MKQETSLTRERPPIVAVVGHIDHGKSTLLDYIRKSNTTEGEAGGITQHLSAYEAVHTNLTGAHKITFLDTPGHEAFRAMRSRGLEVADVAVLVVAADDGAKPQTLEAMKLIDEIKIPYIVALTKIDKPGADIEKAKMSLLENGIYLEGLGGEVPYMPISSKSGEGVPELLDLILLAGELEGLSADPSLPGSGLVIEAHLDQKRGNTATLIVQNGSVESGEYIVSGESFAPVRIMENFRGKPVTEAGPGSPVRIVGFSDIPTIGAAWKTVESKKEAEQDVAAARTERLKNASKPTLEKKEEPEDGIFLTLPLVIKTDFAGTGDAVVHELGKLPVHERLDVRVVSRAAGPVSESDVRLVGSGKHPGIIAGFNVKVEREAAQLAERLGVEIGVFSIIYELTTWLENQMDKHRPRANMEEQTGSAKVLKVFSTTKGKVVLGGKVEDGALSEGEEVKLMRRDVELGRGTIVSLQTQKNAVKKVEAGNEFGAMVKTDIEPAAGDTLHAFEVVNK